jgi:hypothetical protein
VIAAICLAGQVYADAPPPETIDRLITQLGDNDFKMREEASRQLKQIGKPALDALKKATKLDDPEIQTRAEALVKRIEQRPVPGGVGPATVLNVRLSEADGVRTTDINETGRQIQIRQSKNLIEMTVTGLSDGKETTETYTAKDAEELRNNNPEAAKLYERWAHVGADLRLRNGLMIQGGVNGGLLWQVVDPLEVLRERVELQMKEANTPEAKRNEVLALVDKARAANRRELVTDDERDKQLNDYFARSDDLRKKLADLKLPDPGDELPPPANARLGVQLISDPDQGLRVERVVAGGRAAKLGLEAGDVLQKINGKEIRDVTQLRRAMVEAKGRLVIEGLRDEKGLKLAEEGK